MGYLEKAKQLIAKIEDKTEPINIDRECQHVTYSKVLGREIVVSWTGNNPKVVYLDRIPYSTEEIAKLKGTSPEGVRAAHLLKESFEGKITDER